MFFEQEKKPEQVEFEKVGEVKTRATGGVTWETYFHLSKGGGETGNSSRQLGG